MKLLTCHISFLLLLFMQSAYASGAGGLAGRTNAPTGSGNSNLTLYVVGIMAASVIIRIILMRFHR